MGELEYSTASRPLSSQYCEVLRAPCPESELQQRGPEHETRPKDTHQQNKTLKDAKPKTLRHKLPHKRRDRQADSKHPTLSCGFAVALKPASGAFEDQGSALLKNMSAKALGWGSGSKLQSEKKHKEQS